MRLREGQRRVLIVVAILLSIALVSIVVTQMVWPETTVSGVVVDNDGDPLERASVIVSNGPFTESTVTDSNGEFSIPVRGHGGHTLSASKDGYWTQRRTCDVDWSGTSVDGFDFQLAGNQEAYVVYAYVFATTDDNLTAEVFIDGSYPSATVIVEDMSNGGGGFEYTTSGKGVSTNAPGLVFAFTVEVSGEYGDNPGEALNCYAIDVVSGESRCLEEDFLDLTEVTTHYWIGAETATVTNSVRLDGRHVIPSALSPTVSVDILGETFNHTFTVILDDPVGEGGIEVGCHFDNDDVVAHEYIIYHDEAGFLHFWQIG